MEPPRFPPISPVSGHYHPNKNAPSYINFTKGLLQPATFFRSRLRYFDGFFQYHRPRHLAHFLQEKWRVASQMLHEKRLQTPIVASIAIGSIFARRYMKAHKKGQANPASIWELHSMAVLAPKRKPGFETIWCINLQTKMNDITYPCVFL